MSTLHLQNITQVVQHMVVAGGGGGRGGQRCAADANSTRHARDICIQCITGHAESMTAHRHSESAFEHVFGTDTVARLLMILWASKAAASRSSVVSTSLICPGACQAPMLVPPSEDRRRIVKDETAVAERRFAPHGVWNHRVRAEQQQC